MASRALPLIWVVVLALGAAQAQAQQAGKPIAPPRQEPILRIEPGMHTGAIWRVGVDAACTLLATGSNDKTVGLWRLPEGKLVRTLRPPIGPGNDGQVYAVALAPDAAWVAAGGWDSAYDAFGGNFVYIFDTATGAMVTRIGPLRNLIRHLAVSFDGQYLAAALSEGGGVRVWQKSGPGFARWRLVLEDSDYGGEQSNGAAFDRAGALYAVAYDGKLRRYAPGFLGRPGVVATRAGRQLYSVAVHPSGDRVAVGYFDKTAVEVYDTATLSWRFSADTSGATNGNLMAVAWSADGVRLYAGGQYARGGSSPIFTWEQNGQGRGRELHGPENTVTHLLPCGTAMAMGAADPAFGLLAHDGRRLTWREPVQSDLRGQVGDRGFAASVDGRRVRFGLEQWGDRPVLFDLGTEQLTDAPHQLGDLAGPDTTSLNVTGWVNDFNPALNGKPFVLQRLERARALAIAPGAQRFVLGTNWLLRAFDRTGTQLWQKDAPGTTWGVTITRDGKLAVAGYGDGTLRWHRMSDGQELLAVFVHKGDRRWVAWTPKGYYMASPGAETLIGWHVNRGWDEAARFYTVDRFREQFNRPDIVKLVLETLDEGKAIDAANKRAGVMRAEEDVRKLAVPIVVIQKPGDGSAFRASDVVIDYDVYPATGRPITKFEYSVNGRALGARLATERTEGSKITSHKLPLTLPPQDVTIDIVVYEGDRKSAPATLRLRWAGPKPGQEPLRRLRALFIGVNKYASLKQLAFANKDAADLAALFKAHAGRSFSAVEPKLLTDAKREDVIDGLEWLEKGTEADDINLLFLAGHGTTDERQNFYFMAADSEPHRLRATAIPGKAILDTIRALKGARIVMLDTCRAGAGTDAAALAAPSPVDMNRAPNEIGDPLGVLLYASARGRQVSLEYPEWGNGAFTKAVLEALAGQADIDKNGAVETDEIDFYVRRRVAALTKEKGVLQEPVRVKPDTAPEMKLVLLK